MWYAAIGLGGIVLISFVSLVPFFLVLFGAETLFGVLPLGGVAKFPVIMFRNLRRHFLRTSLMYVSVFVLVIVVTLIWSVLYFLDRITSERSKDFKAIVTEKWQLPSQMPFTYLEPLSRGAATSPGDERPQDYMSWQFYGGSVEKDQARRTRENLLFFFCMDPKKLRPMMDDMEDLDERLVQKLLDNDRGCILGKVRLKRLNRQVGDTFTVYGGFNFKEIDLEFEIVGTFPDGRYDDSAVMHWKYLERALDNYQQLKKKPHPAADKSLALVWLKVPDSVAFGRVTQQIESSVEFRHKPVRCETASSGISAWLDAYRDLIFGMRWLLSPAILITMSLVVANAISIGVRERQTEMAVLKVLGYRPWQILVLILGEALFIGAVGGLLSAGLVYLVIHTWMGGFKFPIAFFPTFDVPAAALIWGPAIGLGTALLGSVIPAVLACRVKVSNVFAKVG